MYKLINNLSPPIMNRVFKLNSDIRYSSLQISQFSRSLVKSVYNRFFNFKIKIKKRKPENCSCRLCKVYIDRVGFL